MKKVFCLSSIILLLLVMTIPIFAAYFNCDTCGASINAYCAGGNRDMDSSHRYGFLWLNTCWYKTLAHTTTEICVNYAYHRDSGLDLIYGEIYHDTENGQVICGGQNTANPSCPTGSFAYSS